MSRNSYRKHIHRQAVIAFADDTSWIAKNKEEMTQILRIAEEFYQINNMEINGSKSKLLVWNSNLKKEEKCIQVNKDVVRPEDNQSLIRMLGV